MAMGRRRSESQEQFWIPAGEIAKSPGHPFYARLNQILREVEFDRFAEELCRPAYADRIGRPSIPPGTYFRMLMIGFFEGIDSERGIAWRVADSLSLRSFLGIDLSERTPDHSSLSVIRRRLSEATHEEVFAWVLARLAEHGLVKGRTIGVDATTLEANAAMRSIVRKDTGDDYKQYLNKLAKDAGIENPTEDDLRRMDRNRRKKKTSNDDWEHPHDPDARISRMKDGRTHMGHKAEHAVDMETGATVAVVVRPGSEGDTSSVSCTIVEAIENLAPITGKCVKEVVADKGYHSNDVLTSLADAGIRTYISEPKRGRRRWAGKDRERSAVHSNRRRIRGRRGKKLMRKRGELLERPFAHHYETGRMRRVHLRGHSNIRKRLLVHSAAQNLALLMRTLFGCGTPRQSDGAKKGLAGALASVVSGASGLRSAICACIVLFAGLPRLERRLRRWCQPATMAA